MMMRGRSGVRWVGLAAQIGFRVAQAAGTVTGVRFLYVKHTLSVYSG